LGRHYHYYYYLLLLAPILPVYIPLALLDINDTNDGSSKQGQPTPGSSLPRSPHQMLTPPYHFSIIASSLLPSTHDASSAGPSRPSETLYRGSIPAARNLPFLKRLGLRTIVLLRKKPLKEHDVLLCWAKRHGVDVRWVKAEGMGEENLGMGRTEVGEVLKVSASFAKGTLET
jgi:hypothetical protein